MEAFSNLGLDDIERLQKRGIRLAETRTQGKVVDETNPLQGAMMKQRIRNRKAGDVLNIGSGTRCKHCGMLYFCWVDVCQSCGRQMEYNLGSRQS